MLRQNFPRPKSPRVRRSRNAGRATAGLRLEILEARQLMTGDFFVLTGLSSVVAGMPETVTVQADSAVNVADSSYDGTVKITSSDGLATFSGLSSLGLTLVGGQSRFQATLKSAGTQSLTATDISNSDIKGTLSGITVTPGTATQLVVTAPGAIQAGMPELLTVKAEDAYGNIATDNSGQTLGAIQVTSTDPNAILPERTTDTSNDTYTTSPMLTNGMASFGFRLATAGSETITVSLSDDQTANGQPITGTSGIVDVSPASVVKLVFSTPTQAALVDTPSTFQVTAQDNYGNVVPTDSDTIDLTSSDSIATLPTSLTLTNGVGQFSVAFATAGNPTISVTDATTVGVSRARTGLAVGQIIQGLVYQDQTGSGLYVSGDPKLSGRVVFLDLKGTGQFSSGDPMTTTDSDGGFAFPGYAAGTYPALEDTAQDAGNRNVVDQNSVAVDGSVDLGAVPISTVAPVPIVPDPFGPGLTGSADQAYAQSLYRAVLGRDGAASEVAGWVQVMQGGTSPAQVALDFVNSLEHRTDEVDSYYEQYLGQAADSTATAWIGDLIGGMTEEQVVEGIIGSTAYQSAHVSNISFVDGLYADVLGRSADAPGQASWMTILSSGSMTRAQVAADFIHSPESVDQAVNSFYVNYLRRQPDPTSVTWSTDLEGATGSASAVEQGFLASPEYQSRASANTPVSAGSASAVVESSWYEANLADPQLASLVRQDMAADGQLTRADMITIFEQVEGGGAVTQLEYNDLQTIVGNSTEIVMTPSVRNLATKVVGNSLANQEYQGQALGNLAVGSSATQLGELVGKWFEGLDVPAAAVPYGEPAGSLFGPGGSLGYSQILQGDTGDCYLMATLASIATHDPQTIRNMIVSNGDGTYTVKFFASINGDLTPDYVTVNGELPSNGGSFYYDWASDVSGQGLLSNSNNVLWAALVEKAYAQWTAEGYNLAVSNTPANAYTAIDLGYPDIALQEETGNASYVELDSVPASLTFDQVTTAYDAGSNITFGSDSSPPAANVNPDHDYAMIGYNAAQGTITLFNPWGVYGGYGSDGVFKQGLLFMTMTEIEANFGDINYLSGTITT